MLMSVLGGMSESERQHVQAWVRAAMDAQVVKKGRHQGGRAPYGYVVVDADPHPNPRKAAEGFRLRVLAIEEFSAEVVRRIFAEYLEGSGDRAIASGLNGDGIPCPSARRPDQNRHRLADGWRGSTVRAILENPRYTGYVFFGRSVRHEMLLDPDDMAAGHVIRFRRASPDRVVRSREPAHPAIVSVETFTQAQLRRRSRAAVGWKLGASWSADCGRRSTPTCCLGASGACTARAAWKACPNTGGSTTGVWRAPSRPVRRARHAPEERLTTRTRRSAGPEPLDR
jgi:recombinase